MNEQLVGKWAGNIEIPNVSLPIIVDLQKKSGTLSVPVQGLHDYPFNNITYDGDKVSIQIELNGAQIEIDGALNDEQIDATFKQNGGVFPIRLKKHVEEPVTYETITVPVEHGDLKIAVQKSSKHPSPVALILAGSGPTNKDGNSAIAGKNDSLKMLAEGLANEGIATVRYDKRGIGENMMLVTAEEELSLEQYVDDAVRVIETLKVDSAYTSVHIIGHSEGSLIGMLAAKQTQINSFISLAGAGRAADEILLEQLEGQLPPTLKEETTTILASLKKGERVENASPELQALFRSSVQPYMISWLKYNPAHIIETLEIPTLIIQGTTDIQINAADAEALKNANTNATLLYVEGMNHILKNAPAERTANIATYTDPSLPLHEELLPAISTFILE
ncbi:alpha/beta hydrolase [Solibacillus sp. CAU 1738]|uniref:alpha/beta hydrolase n=1 Tax=Solibacillus sp. CAU 1738 TaxID=3140363 RepID=UPI0032604715